MFIKVAIMYNTVWCYLNQWSSTSVSQISMMCVVKKMFFFIYCTCSKYTCMLLLWRYDVMVKTTDRYVRKNNCEESIILNLQFRFISVAFLKIF